MNDLIVAKVDTARSLLAEASNAQEAKKVVDLAHAAEIYARRQKLSEEAIGFAHEVKVDAERLLGEFLANSPRNRGGELMKARDSTCSKKVQVESLPPTLDEIGISRKESSDAQFLFDLDTKAPEIFDKVRQRELSVTQAKRELVKLTSPEPPPLPKGKYRVLLADPPWSYSLVMPDYVTSPRDYYPTLTLQEICDYGVKDLAAENSVLFLMDPKPDP